MNKFSQRMNARPTSHTARIGTLATAIVSVGLLAACSDSSTAASLGSHSQLGFALGSTATAAADNAPVSLTSITVGTHTLTFTDAVVTISRAELKIAPTDVCADDNDDNDQDVVVPTAASADRGGSDNENHECAEIKVGPATIDLPITGDLATIPADAIPPGTYREFEVRLSQVELTGKFDTTAFDVVIPVHVRAEIEFDTPLVVTAGQPTTITVSIPVITWLTNPDGSLVDPNQILTTPALLTQVKNRIAQSLRAFEDDDHNGRDDHSGPGKNGNGSNQGGPGN